MNTTNGTLRDAVSGVEKNNRMSQQGVPPTNGKRRDIQGRSPFLRKAIGSVSKRFVVSIAITVVVLAILLLGGLFTIQDNAVLPPVRNLDVEVVTAVAESAYDVHRSYLGKIESRRHSCLGFEVSGKINTVDLDEGQSVTKGAVLAELDTRILRSNRDVINSRIEAAQAKLDELIAGPRVEDVQSAKAQVRRWQSQLKLARITTKRLLRLNASNAVAQQETDNAVYNEQVVRAQLDLATAQLAELENGTRREQIAAQRATVSQLRSELHTIEINIEKSRLLAPYDGVISARLLDEREVIANGQPVFEMLDNRQLEARVGIPVGSIEAVKKKANHQLVYRSQDIDATLKSIRPEKNADTRTVDIVFQIDASKNSISIGDIVRLELSESTHETGYWIPTAAMVESYRGLWGCYVAEPVDSDSSDHVARLRELEVLHQEGELAFVRGALHEGEQIIVSGVHRIVPGQNVQLAIQRVAFAHAVKD